MFIRLSADNPAPMYRQVTDQIRDAIAAGELQSDQLLPSIRELALELGVSVITIKRAYQDLENDGLIRARRGMGSFVCPVDPAEMRQAKLKEIDALPLLADNTLVRQDIALELQKYERAGVPLVLVYPKNPDAPPIVLPTVLTPSVVLEALEEATR